MKQFSHCTLNSAFAGVHCRRCDPAHDVKGQNVLQVLQIYLKSAQNVKMKCGIKHNSLTFVE